MEPVLTLHVHPDGSWEWYKSQKVRADPRSVLAAVQVMAWQLTQGLGLANEQHLKEAEKRILTPGTAKPGIA